MASNTAAKLKLVHSAPNDYPEASPETVRPYRLWDPGKGSWLVGRFYSTPRRALDQALVLTRWEKIGYTIEVLDARTNEWLGVYKHTPTSIAYEHKKGILSEAATIEA